MITLVPYSASWAASFESESKRLKQALGVHVVRIHHIGSTAIHGIMAKPAIDIIIEYACPDDITIIDQRVQQLGYKQLQKNILPYISFFSSYHESDSLRYHLHVYPLNDAQVFRHLRFRDYLNEFSDIAKEYEKTKLKAAAEFPDDIQSYIVTKGRLVREIDALARRHFADKSYADPNQNYLLTTTTSMKAINEAMYNSRIVYKTELQQYMLSVDMLRIPEYTAIRTGLDDYSANYFIQCFLNDENANSICQQYDHWFSDSKSIWYLAPTELDAQTPKHLIQHDYVKHDEYVGVYFELTEKSCQYALGDLLIRRVMEPQQIKDYFQVHNEWLGYEVAYVKAGLFKDDVIQFFVGYIDEKPIATAALVMAAGTAGFYGIKVLEAHRQRGYAQQITQYMLNQAYQLGYIIGLAQCYPISLKLFSGMDYVEIATYLEYR